MDVIDAARSYSGTPFVPSGRLPGIGLDCLGVVVCAGRDAGILSPEMDLTEWSTPTAECGAEQLGRFLRRRPDGHGLVAGDVLLFSIRDRAHLAVCAGDSFIHASTFVMRVVEQPLDARWLNRLHAAFAFEVVSG